MRVAIITEVFLPKIDGVVNRTLNLIRQSAAFRRRTAHRLPPRSKDAPTVRCLSSTSPAFLFPSIRNITSVCPTTVWPTASERFAPDVLHYVNPLAFGFRCHDVFRKAAVHVPSVFSFHTMYGEFVKRYKALKPLSALIWWLMRAYHNCADVNLTVSGIMQEELVRRNFKRVELWPPAVDNALFHPGRKSAAMRARLTQRQAGGGVCC